MIILFTFVKGGVGKSSIAFHVAAYINSTYVTNDIIAIDEEAVIQIDPKLKRISVQYRSETVFADAGYQGVSKRCAFLHSETQWHVAERPGRIRAMKKRKGIDKINRAIERSKASIRAKVEHPFRVIKCQLGFIKARYRGMKKNGSQLNMLFALSNLFQARRKLLLIG